jgi:electron transfer flavoprotein beta subunit
VPVKIIALVKYSMDVAEVKVDHATGSLRMTGVPYRFGELDRGVVEAAVRVKESTGADLEVLTFGPPAALGAMRDLLAMGADEATLVEDPYDGAADGAIAARVLEAAVRRRGPAELIVCGFASDDGYSYQTAPRLSERVGLPLVSYVSELEVDGDNLSAERDLDNSVQSVRVRLPAIASIAEEAFVPRTVTLIQAMKAQKKPTNRLSLDELGLDKAELDQARGYSSVSETGVSVKREQRLLKGSDLAAMADGLIDYLVEEKILVEEGQ